MTTGPSGASAPDPGGSLETTGLTASVGVAGLSFATLLQVLMLGMTGRTAIIHRNNAQLQLADTVFTNSGEAIVVTDDRGYVVSTNPAFTRITGLPPRRCMART